MYRYWTNFFDTLSLEKMSKLVAYPPEEWEIFPEDSFVNTAFEASGEETEAHLMVQVNREAKIEGLFKLQLAGKANIEVELKAEKFLPLSKDNGYNLGLEVRPKEMGFRPNACSTHWMDVEKR